MLRFILLAALGACVHGFVENAHLCDEINSIDCATNYNPTETNEVVCGSDGKTYKNFCYYSQARCKTPTTHIAYVGACSSTTPAPATTTPSLAGSTTTVSATVVATATRPTGSQVVTTQDVLTQVFCASKDTVTCSTDLQPVCGSNGAFYLNRCEFSKGQCDDNTLTLKAEEFCLNSGGR